MDVGVVIKPGTGHFDRVLSEVVILPTLDFWRSMGVTPNILTGIGSLSSMSAMYAFRKNAHPLITTIFVLLRMYFDYADGMFARKYNMTTAFGDWFDHASDVGFFLSATYLTGTLLPKGCRMIGVTIMVCSLFLACIQMSCLEQECGTRCVDSTTLGILAPLNGFCYRQIQWCDNSLVYAAFIAIVWFRWSRDTCLRAPGQ